MGFRGSAFSTRSHRRHLRRVRLVQTFQGSILNGRHAPYGALWWNLTHWRASQVFPVSEAKHFCVKTGFLSHSVHKTTAAIDGNGEPENGVFLPVFLSWITSGFCWFSDEGMWIALALLLSGGVCGYTCDQSWRSGAEDLSQLCWWALDGRQA